MPTMDMTDAFAPEFMDNFSVIRNLEVVNSFGESTITTTNVPTVYGVITAGDDNKLAIGSDEQHQGKSIQVVTPFRLRGVSEVPQKDANGNTYQPDLVIWNGDAFKVIVVEDYSRYGVGWVRAQCTSQDYVDQPPPEPISATVF